MKITVDTELCTQHGLTIEQAALLKAKLNPEHNLEEQFILKNSRLEPYEIARVESIYEKLKKKQKPTEADNWAEEFWGAFPQNCTGPDGRKRYLRQGILKRQALSEYKKRVKTKDQHEMALTYMINDVEDRKRSGEISWIKSIVKYIQEEPWNSLELKGSSDGFVFGGDIE